MTVLTRTQLRQLTGHRAEAAVSLFMPVEPTFARLPENLVRLEALVQSAYQMLVVGGMEERLATELLHPFQQLREHELFWCATGHGLAAFASPHLFRAYRVPWNLHEQLRIGTNFSITPLLPLLEAGGRFYVLALCEGSARLYEASEHSIQQISLPLHVTAEAESLSRDGFAADSRKRQASEFCRLVSDAVGEVLHGQEAPLVLACVGYIASLFQFHNRYEHLLKAKIPGNPSLWSVDELRVRAWEHVAPVFRKQKELALRLYADALGSDQAANEVNEILKAANQGRIRMLLITQDGQQDGEPAGWDGPDKLSVSDALGQAVSQTINHGGTVLRVDRIPIGHSSVAALLRP